MNGKETSNLKHQELWEAFWKDRDSKEALTGLLNAWMPFLTNVLDGITIRLPSHIQVEDLLQVALLGLCEAIERFDPDRGMGFESFAYHRIRGSIMDELRLNDHLSKNERAKVNAMKEAMLRLARKNGSAPDEDELARELGLKPSDLASLVERSQAWLSLEQVVASDDGGRQIFLQDVLADENAMAPDTESERSDVRNYIRQAFRQLTDREQKILYLYYFEDLKLAEIARLFGLTEARICQLHSLAVLKLKTALDLHAGIA
jgi:RNA polymerase sigma factor FliA